MLRYDVQAKRFETVFDVSAKYGNRYIWQMHSSNDDRVHSATLRDGSSYEMLGCVAYREDRQQWFFIPKTGDFDECQIDKSGRWLVIKENVDGRNGEDNRIIDLETGAEQVLLDENGAAGHSDIGHGYMVAEDNFNAQPGAVRRVALRHGHARRPARRRARPGHAGLPAVVVEQRPRPSRARQLARWRRRSSSRWPAAATPIASRCRA